MYDKCCYVLSAAWWVAATLGDVKEEGATYTESTPYDNAYKRSGIPEEDWAAVVTVYEEGHKLAQFTGNEGSRNGRVLLLDGAGEVVFYHARGYSVGSLNKLVAARAALR